MSTKQEHATHTPTPWAIQQQTPDDDLYIIGAEPNSAFIAKMEYEDFSGSDLNIPEANAALIVRAVNAHAELVAACKLITECANDSHAFPDALEQARAALRKAGA